MSKVVAVDHSHLLPSPLPLPQATAVCKPWPVNSLQLSCKGEAPLFKKYMPVSCDRNHAPNIGVALPPTTLLSCGVSGGELVTVTKMGPTSYVPLAHSIIAEPRLVTNKWLITSQEQ